MLWRPFRERSFIPGPGARLITGHPLTNGLIGIWPMNEGGGKTAFNPVSPVNTGTWAAAMNTSQWTGGQWGTAVDFLGAGSGSDIPVGVQPGPPLHLTFCAWVWVRAYEANTTIIADTGVTELRLAGVTGRLQFTHNIGVGGAAAADSVAITQGEWHHVAGTWDGAIVEVWIDGIRRGATVDVSVATLNGTICLGDSAGGVGEWAGFAQDFRIYNRGLTPNELVEITENPADIWEDTSLRIFDLAVPPPIVPPNVERLCDNDCCGIFFGPGVA